MRRLNFNLGFALAGPFVRGRYLPFQVRAPATAGWGGHGPCNGSSHSTPEAAKAAAAAVRTGSTAAGRAMAADFRQLGCDPSQAYAVEVGTNPKWTGSGYSDTPKWKATRLNGFSGAAHVVYYTGVSRRYKRYPPGVDGETERIIHPWISYPEVYDWFKQPNEAALRKHVGGMYVTALVIETPEEGAAQYSDMTTQELVAHLRGRITTGIGPSLR